MRTTARLLGVCLLGALALILLLSASGCGGGTSEPPTTVRGTITGTVTGPTGTPLAGATVQLNSATVAPVTTGSNGAYTIGNVRAGTYKALGTYASSTTGAMTGSSAEFTIDAAHTNVTANITVSGSGPPPPPF